MGTERPNKITVAVRFNRSDITRMDRIRENTGHSRGGFAKKVILDAFEVIESIGYPEFLKKYEQPSMVNNGCIGHLGTVRKGRQHPLKLSQGLAVFPGDVIGFPQPVLGVVGVPAAGIFQ